MAKITLDGFKDLYASMREQNIERHLFDYKFLGVEFNVFFFIDGRPFILLFGVKGANVCFEIEVREGFQVDNSLERDLYDKLCNILGYDPKNRFYPNKFFEAFNKKIPR
ncbi:MAG: rloe protein, partial [bacterium]|nr:rloe protein [bacterium]